ncbi:MAG: branched-chain amino acid ABC transporter permease [Burkholderiales bacterium]|nr:branched-chain amino acid ABC transporter permease [Burkholderiales bacterium]
MADTLRRHIGPIAALALAIAFPFAARALGQEFYVGFASRVLILALFASSLNLIVGLGGMVSLGHAALFGAGAYVVGIASAEIGPGTSALLTWPLAMGAGALLALFIGAISLRTHGVYFIMITLAFAQMVYYVFVSLKAWGGDDGLSLPRRSSLPGVSLADDVTFYLVVLALCAAVVHALARLSRSRFGVVLVGIRDNEARMASLGYATFRYRLVAFVISGALAGLAGALMANQNNFVSPNMMHWEQSGVALVMVILGGLASPWGGLAGAGAFLILEEALQALTRHWQIPLGVILLLVVFFAPRGIAGGFERRR